MAGRQRAIACTELGGPEVLRITELDVPEPGHGQVRVAVKATGVNPLDWKIRSGRATFVTVDFPWVPGVEFAGVVDAVGDGVTEFAVGDDVLGTGSATYAEYTVADTENITPKPAGMPWEVAGGLPVVATTTYRVLALLGLTEGETLLIDGAAGGVGTVAVQVAKHRGLIVIGTASERNHEYLRSLGAIPVTYGDGLADRVRTLAPNGIDAAMDLSGRGGLRTLVELVGGPERVVTIADDSAAELGVRMTFGGADEVPGALADAAALVSDGVVSLPIARTYPLAEAATAHRDSEDGHVRGKLVILPG